MTHHDDKRPDDEHASDDTELSYDPPHAHHISPQAIAEAAYYRWLKRGAPHGSPHVDWLAAEEELKKKHKKDQDDT